MCIRDSICYDIRFPELTRHLALSGADVIVHPTNWPYGSEYTRDVLPLARAFENGVYFLSCNRVGDEKSSHFIGGARVVGCLLYTSPGRKRRGSGALF